MKLLTVLVLAAGLVLGLVVLKASDPLPVEAREVPRVLSAAPAAGHVVLAFDVQGMCCTTCPQKLRDAVGALDGVRAIAADPVRGRVEVEAESALAPETLAAALTFDKYVATPLPR